MPYETVSAATVGTSHGSVSCAPYPTIVDSSGEEARLTEQDFEPEFID
jgi:hypothetical protein